MDPFKAETRRMFLASIKLAFLMATVVVFVSADCNDPGTPDHGSRTVSSADGGFADGTIVYFFCNAHYKLVQGAKKILCSKGIWNGKKPTCQSQLGCPYPPPTFAHAHVTSNPGSNTKPGSYITYACDSGYTSDHRPTRLLCDKDYNWSGSITCQKVLCGPPPAPKTGHGNVSITSTGSTTRATYYCYPGYVLKDYRPFIVDIFYLSCDQSGTWPARMAPTCVKTCKSSDVDVDHGFIKKVSPQYMSDPTSYYFYTQNVKVTFACEDLYRLQGNSSRTCLDSGLWSGTNPRCVLSSCRSPGDITHGSITSNSSDASKFPIWTTVTFNCYAGYRLVGPSSRQCQTNGQWTGRHNPTCQKSLLTCKPKQINYGYYKPVKSTYLLNDRIEATCNDGYYLYGVLKLKCSSLPGGELAEWLPAACSDANNWAGCSSSLASECLTAAMYDEKCRERGLRAKIDTNRGKTYMYCESSEGTDENPTTSKPRDSELNKMTIVVATAGSTLGALVVLLTALVCFRRFHRSRRFRHSALRSRRYSDDDRIAIIAAYTGDVHFILPSYDEAINQVERLPPSFESVVEGAQNSGNQLAITSSDPAANQVANPRSNIAAGNTNSDEQINDSARIRELDPTTEEQPIHIVSNPLADSAADTGAHAPSETVQSADHTFSSVNERGVNISDESIDTGDDESSPNDPPESLPSSSSEDDLSSNQTQPLLGNDRRGVMV